MIQGNLAKTIKLIIRGKKKPFSQLRTLGRHKNGNRRKDPCQQVGLESKAEAAEAKLCFQKNVNMACPSGQLCQYCQGCCCRTDLSHVSHRCSQHVNW